VASVAFVRRSFLAHALLSLALAITVPTWWQTPRAGDVGATAPPASLPTDQGAVRRLSPGERSRALDRIAGVPLHFERNIGQAGQDLDFVATGAGYRVGLSSGSATVVLTDRDRVSGTFRFALEGARTGLVAEPLDTLPGTTSYYRGNDPAAWQVGATTHARVRYANVFDGVDVVYYGNQQRLQYDFIVAPGADPAQVAFRVEGAERVSLGDDGQLQMAAGGRVLEQAAPYTYQVVDGQRREVSSRFVLEGTRVRFEVGEYDRARALVIDPVVAYASWLGGQSEEGILDIAIDGAGNLVLFGFVQDAAVLVDFPTTDGAVKRTRNGAFDFDVFVTKFNPSGTTLLFSTLLGGSDYELFDAYNYEGGLALDTAGNIHVTGTTQSGDFPTTTGAFDTTYNSDPRPSNVADGFYVKLSSTGALLYGTYFGGRANDQPHGIDVDAAGNAYIVGETSSTTTADPSVGGFTLTGDAFDTTLQNTEAFLLRFSAAGQLTYGTYIGGSSSEAQDSTDVRVSRTTPNVVYVVGDTRSTNLFPGGLTPALPSSNSGSRDGFVLRLNLALTGAAQATYGTYFGGTGEETVASMALDASDNVYVAGSTSSSSATFPQAVTVPGSVAPSGTDVVVAKFNPAVSSAASLVFAARINGFYTDTGYDIALDSQNQPWVGVNSGSLSPTPNAAQDFPVVNPVQNTRSGNGQHQMIVQLNAAGTALLMSSPIGGRGGRGGPVGVAVTGSDEVWVGGSSSGGTDRLAVVTPFQASYGGGDADATLQRIGLQADLTLTKSVDKPYPQVTVLPGESMTYTLVVNNATGDTVRNVVVTDNLPAEVVFVSCASTAGGVCSGSGNNRTITIPSLASGASATITIATTVAAGVGPGQVWTNTATVAHNGSTDPNPGNNTGNVGNGAPTLTNAAGDADGDGLSNGFEQKFGLNGLNNSPGEGAAGDPDGDGKTNAQEQAEGTHPRGFVITFLAEGATGGFFDTRLAIANPTGTQALVLTRFQKGDGTTISDYRVIPPFSRSTIDVETLAGLEGAEFSTLVEADVQVVADRTMSWDGNGYGSHAERGILTRTATRWYFAEGATFGPFNLFYLVQNPNATPAQLRVTYLLGTGAPLTKTYTVAAQSRFNIWVDNEGVTDPALAALANAELSAIIESTNGVPIIAERAMYLDQPGRALGAGHESAGVTAPATQWFLAEGSTGSYFDLFILIANPNPTPATIEADYLLTTGQVITRSYTVPGNSRFNIWVDQEPGLADVAVSTRVRSTNGVPIIVERSMWWPGPTSATWQEAHNSPGETTTGTRWAMAEGESGGPRDTDTYVLIANTSPFAGTIRATVLFEDGTPAVTREYAIGASARFNIAPAADEFFPETRGKRFGMLIESIGGTPAQIVVERAMYSDAGGVNWAAGTNALATKLQ
jgi:uncharacterized repeat protein (TIGR01451 family)